MATTAYAEFDIVQMIRDEINEPVARVFSSGTESGASTTDLERFIDLGARACFALALGNQAEQANITLVENTSGYALSTTFCHIESVECITSATGVVYGLQRANMQVLGNSVANTAGRPAYYFVHPSNTVLKVWVFPVPSSAVAASDTMSVKGYSVSTSFGAGTTEPLNLPYGLRLTPLYYALSCVYARLGKHRLSALNMQKFIMDCNRWRTDVIGAVRNVDSYDLARIPDVVVTRQ